MKILIFGDTSDVNLPDFSIKRLNPEIYESITSADHVIYNLEGPIEFSTETLRYRENKLTNAFIGTLVKSTNKVQPIITSTPTILDLLKINSKTTFTLANNHIKDAGKLNLYKTVSEIEEQGGNVVGYGNNSRIQYDCFYIPESHISILNYNFVGSHKNKIPLHLYDVNNNSFGATHKHFGRIRHDIDLLHQNSQKVILVLHIGTALKPYEQQNIPFEDIKLLNADITVLHNPHIYFQTPYEKDNIFVLGDFIFHRPKKLDLDRPSSYLEINYNSNTLSTKLHTHYVRDYYEWS